MVQRHGSTGRGFGGGRQAVEHYDIPRYGTLKTWATRLGYYEAAKLFDTPLNEEVATDQQLSQWVKPGPIRERPRSRRQGSPCPSPSNVTGPPLPITTMNASKGGATMMPVSGNSRSSYTIRCRKAATVSTLIRGLLGRGRAHCQYP